MNADSGHDGSRSATVTILPGSFAGTPMTTTLPLVSGFESEWSRRKKRSIMPEFGITLLLAIIVSVERLSEAGDKLLVSNRIARYALAMTSVVGVGFIVYSLSRLG